MNIRKLEDVLAEMRQAQYADGARLRDWETRIADAISDELLTQIQASIAATPDLSKAPGGHDWE